MSEEYSTQKLEPLCYIQNCLECSEDNNCSVCKHRYTLVNNRCLSTDCEVFGQCKFCTDFDCVYCSPGYQVEYGFCEKGDNLVRFEILLGVVLPLFIVVALSLIVYFVRRRRIKLAMEKNMLNEVINSKKKPKSGQYIIINTTNINNSGNINGHINNNVNITNTQGSEGFPIIERESGLKENFPVKGFQLGSDCVICHSKQIFSFAQCGCGLCKEHTFVRNMLCPNHQTSLSENFIVKKNFKKIVKKNSENSDDEKNDVKMCAMCRIAPGTVSFNCGCPMLLCGKCYNDNIYVSGFNQCPGDCSNRCQNENPLSESHQNIIK